MPKESNKPPPKRGPPAFHVRFANVSVEEAAQGLKKASERQNTTVPARSLASDIQLNELSLTPEQRSAIGVLNASDAGVDAKFYVNGAQEQQSQYEAAALMASHGLDLDSREDNGNRWSVRWSTSKDGGKTRRVLLQCDCGYDHRLAGSKKRRTAVDFTGCLAHAEITFVIETQKILRVRGLLEHNEACKTALMQRIPALPLHPSVYQAALMQLANGVSLTDIQRRNREWVASGGGGLIPTHGKDWRHRWLLQRYDTRSLYRQYSRLNGVKLTEKPHINLDEWLNPHSPQYHTTLAAAIFHYSARAAKDDRLEAAWKYGYKSQIVVDGTFGICDNEDKKGVPLAFLIFSAPSGNQLSSSGYDADILTKLLKIWRTSLEQFRGGKSFYVLERIALLRVFPGIVLLICKFHLRQSWRNHRNKLVTEVKARLRLVEEKLVSTTTLAAAIVIIDDERRTSHGAPAERGLEHLGYLSSWSDFGRYTAAGILGCEFEGSFNGLLKRKYLRRWQRGGRRLRVDVLINRRMQRAERDRIAEWIRSLPGGESLLQAKLKPFREHLLPVAFFVTDPSRDAAATQLLENNQISVPTFEGGTFSFTCYSSYATEFDTNPITYEVEIRTNGTASCSGPDFLNHGGACKHIRAGLLKMSDLRRSIPDIPLIYLPTSEAEARVLQGRLALHSSTSMHDTAVGNPTTIAAQNINELLVGGVAYTHQEDEDSSEDEEGDCEEEDNKSVATDASADGDEMNVGNFIQHHSGTSATAVDNQAIARVSYELSRNAPKMAELGDCLANVEGVHSETQRAQLAAFCDPLEALVSQLKRLSISSPTPTGALPQQTPTASSGARPRATQRDSTPPTCLPDFAVPIPPSPERRRQERKDSYSCH
ncbi:hypothetical protein C8R46DRAFT_1162244 [Mycena filopes]|nr:hypothetical protein C8R46DRAFT_1162244 [Mycena filopes]